MKKMKRFFALLMALICVLSLVACGGKDDKGGDKDEGAKDTLLVLSAGAFQGAWDPAANCILANKHAEWNIFDRLIHKDAEGNLSPGIAGSVPNSV